MKPRVKIDQNEAKRGGKKPTPAPPLVRNRNTRIDWAAAKAMYIHGDGSGVMPSCADIAKKLGTHPNTISKRAWAEGWVKLRKDNEPDRAAKVSEGIAEASVETAIAPVRAETDYQVRMLEQQVAFRAKHFGLQAKGTAAVDEYLKARVGPGEGAKLLLTIKEGKELAAMSRTSLQAAGLAVFGMQPKDVSLNIQNYLNQQTQVSAPEMANALWSMVMKARLAEHTAPVELIAEFEEQSTLPFRDIGGSSGQVATPAAS